MNFTLDAGGGGQAAGQGLGNLFKALAQGGSVRQNAEITAAAPLAAARKNNAEAFGQEMTNDQRVALDPTEQGITPYERALRTAFKWTGDRNIENVSKANLNFQSADLRQRATDTPNLSESNRLTSISSGKPYEPYDNVGDTGFSLDKATGRQVQASPVLAKLFGDLTRAKTLKAEGGETVEMPDGTVVRTGKALTTAQLKADREVDAARKYVKDLPREIVATVLRKNESELSAQDKDILTRIRKARTAKYGEGEIPAEYNDALGLDQNIVQSIAQAIANPGTKHANIFQRVLGLGEDRPYTQDEAIQAATESLPEFERPNKDRYVLAGRQRAQAAPIPENKNTAAPSNGPKMAPAEISATLQKARDAIAKGADRSKVIARLQQNGIDTTGL